tara:strand:- start:198 stop:584 length:387 start_codon:yes stop_codon:yes gene_type:complete
MANTFKTVTFLAEPATAGANSGLAYVVYTAPSSITTIVLGLTLANIHTAQVTADVYLVSNTANRGGATGSLVANTNSFIVKGAPIPVGGALELMSGNKIVLETTDQIVIDCSVADKLSGTLSIMEIDV